MPNRRFFLIAAAVICSGSGILGFFIGDRRDDVAVNPPPATVETPERPLIGIASLDQDTYIRDHGGLPVVLPNTDGSIETITAYLKELDGLMMPGGLDIPPSEYGEETHPTVSILSDDRYRLEKALINQWIQKSDKPLLGICLGSQWINVAHGGSLIQDIPSEIGGNHRDVLHEILIEPDSRLSSNF